MIEWWNNMDLVGQIYALIAIPATLVLLVQTVMLLFGFGEDDFIGLTREFNLSMNRRDLYDIYKNFKDKHDCMLFHSHLDEVEVELHGNK